MPDYAGIITNFVAGDHIDIERTITTLPSGQIISNAWFTVKNKRNDLDIDALIQKEITTILTSGTGWIEDTGTDTIGLIHFFLTPDDTMILTAFAEYHYDIQIKTNAGMIYTPEIGTISAHPQITRAT